jgi:FkbM family methyltransferase
MHNITLYQFLPRQIITPPKEGSYFIRDFEAVKLCNDQVHNPEWYIQQKITDNVDGYFDFSRNMIDIGACYGTYSVVLPFQKFFMFEPNKEYFSYCHANMLLHQKTYQAELFNAAVSDHSGTIRFDGFVSGDLANEFGHSWTQTPCIDVPCIRLDDIKDRLTNIGFIKIDIEGHEPYALAGMAEVLRQNGYPPVLFESWANGNEFETEEHRVERTQMLENIFAAHGYTILYGWGDDINHLAVHE